MWKWVGVVMSEALPGRELDPSVLEATRLGVVVGDRLALAVADRSEPALVDALLDQIGDDRVRSALREIEVVGVAGLRVGVAPGLDDRPLVAVHRRHHLVERAPSHVAELGRVRAEDDVLPDLVLQRVELGLQEIDLFLQGRSRRRRDDRQVAVLIDGVPVTVQALANLKISSEPALLANAVERLLELGNDPKRLEQVSRSTLEGQLRMIVGTLKVEEIIQDHQV